MMDHCLTRHSLVMFCVLGFFRLPAQDVDVETQLQWAQQAFYNEDFYEALQLYQSAESEMGELTIDASYKMEICSLLTDFPGKSLDQFDLYAATMKSMDKFYLYWKGRILMRRYEYDTSEEAFNAFLAQKVYLSNEIKREVRSWVNSFAEIQAMMGGESPYEIVQLEVPINSTYSEVSPVFFEEKNELLYLSNRDALDGQTYLIYHTYRDDNGRWMQPQSLIELGSFLWDNTNIEVVAEDERLFQFRPEKGGDLFYSEPLSGNVWTVPEEFDSKITTTNISSHFFINQQEDRIIFSRAVGKKDEMNLDLFESSKDPMTGDWGRPHTIAPGVNSEWDEDSPYLSTDERYLYFASTGHGAIGGYDIYRSEYSPLDMRWSEPENLGFPINTPDDEMHFKLNQEQTSGYFSSNRVQTNGSYDIFFFSQPVMIQVEGQILVQNSDIPLQQGQILFKTNDSEETLYLSAVDLDGNFSTKIKADKAYTVEVKQDGNVLSIQPYLSAKPSDEVIQANFYIDEAVFGASMFASQSSNDRVELRQLGSKFRQGNRAILENMYFWFGTSQIKHESVDALIDLKNLLQENEDLQIEIEGHTDSVGDVDVNEWLSYNRANFIKNWLVRNGISPDRLKAVGYGAAQPIASNDHEYEGRELNRRIEIVVLE